LVARQKIENIFKKVVEKKKNSIALRRVDDSQIKKKNYLKIKRIERHRPV
jgi:hypothetical protein